MRVKVGEVDDKVKQTKGGTIWRAKASWDGYQEQWTSFYFQPQSGAEYDAKIKSREWQGKIYWTVSEGQLVGAATQAQPAPQPSAPRAPTGYPARAYTALESLIGKSAQSYAPEEGKLKAAVFGCMWISMSKDPVTMTEMAAQEEGARGGASSSGDELPTDENIPF